MPDTQTFSVVIPARFASSRFPGKPLVPIAGRPMLWHVWQAAVRSAAARVVVATDDRRIADVAHSFGADVAMTASTHRSGTDRCAEVAAQRQWSADHIVVNCQGDAPLTPPASLTQVVRLLAGQPQAGVATLCTPIESLDDYRSPHVVKVVCDQAGRALYFSRAAIPASAHGAAESLPQSFRHIGLYGYRVGALAQLTAAPPAPIEAAENLEQLRALYLGIEIRVGVADTRHGPDVDVPDDIGRAEAWLRAAQDHSG